MVSLSNHDKIINYKINITLRQAQGDIYFYGQSTRKTQS